MTALRRFLKAELALTFSGWLVLLIVSALVSNAFYVRQQSTWRAKAIEAVAEVDVITAFCQQKATLNELGDACRLNEDGEPRMSRQAAWMLMRDVGLIDPNLVQHPDDIGSDSPISQQEMITFLTEPVGTPNRVMPGLQFFQDVLTCKEGTLNADKPSAYSSLMQHAVQFALGTEADQIDVLSLPIVEDQEGRINLQETIKGYVAAWSETASPLPLLEGVAPLSDAQIVTRGMVEAGVFGSGAVNYTQALPSNGETCLTLIDDTRVLSDEEKDRAIYDILVARSELALWVAGQVRQEPGVTAARSRAALWTGYEQAGLLFFGVFGGLLVTVRLLTAFWSWRTGRLVPGPSWPHEDVLDGPDGLTLNELLRKGTTRKLGDPDYGAKLTWDQHRQLFSRIIGSARWPLKMVMAVLPAIGFIGTVRGIKESLTGADALVFAATNNERAAAIGALAGDLGLAFATTFIALLMTLVLTILIAVEIRVIDLIGLRRMKKSALKTFPRPSDLVDTDQTEARADQGG